MLGSRIISKFYLEIKILIWWIIEIKDTVDHVSDAMQEEAGIFSGHHTKFCPMSDMDLSNRIKIRMNIWNYKPSCKSKLTCNYVHSTYYRERIGDLIICLNNCLYILLNWNSYLITLLNNMSFEIAELLQ